jgi:crotonobetainyl-CoA:carnitine CoA-transferase CaiB-like acyl-CoA transferase
VLVENFKVGDLRRYGLGYEQVAAANPGVVYASITGYGQTGPRAAEPGYDLVMQAMTGLLHMTGDPDGGPARVGVALIDVLSGQQAAIGVLAALRQREHTGRGQHLDLSLFDVGLVSMVNVAQAALVTGEAPQRLGSGHPSIVPYQAFPTADGDLAIAAGNDQQFQRLCEVVDRPELGTDPRFATNADRVEHREELIGCSRRCWPSARPRSGSGGSAPSVSPPHRCTTSWRRCRTRRPSTGPALADAAAAGRAR